MVQKQPPAWKDQGRRELWTIGSRSSSSPDAVVFFLDSFRGSPCHLPQDKSWRVRYNVAQQLSQMCEALGPEVSRTELSPAFVKLLRDNEAEVRVAAAGKVSAFCKLLSTDQAKPPSTRPSPLGSPWPCLMAAPAPALFPFSCPPSSPPVNSL